MKHTYLLILLSACSLDGAPLPYDGAEATTSEGGGVARFLDAMAAEVDADTLSAMGLAGGPATEPPDAEPQRADAGLQTPDAGLDETDSGLADPAPDATPSDASSRSSTCGPCSHGEGCAEGHLCLWPPNEDEPRCFPRKVDGDPACNDWGSGLTTFELEDGTRFCAPRTGTCDRWSVANGE